jgi:hypothetical protein
VTLSPRLEDLVIIASGVYDRVRNDPRFKAGLQRIRAQLWERARRDRARGGL